MAKPTTLSVGINGSKNLNIDHRKEVTMNYTHCAICLRRLVVPAGVDAEKTTLVCGDACELKEHQLRAMFPYDPRDNYVRPQIGSEKRR